MDCKVIISPRAIQDLEEIVRYISFNDPRAAERLGYALIDAALSLATFPEHGRLVPEFNDDATRELIHGSYRIVYRVDPERQAVFVSRFWHAARLLTRD
jgi:plasmid stabilization system protein ParE